MSLAHAQIRLSAVLLLVALAMLSWTGLARAQRAGSEGHVEAAAAPENGVNKAAALWARAGDQALSLGRYRAASHAFRQAYAVLKDPAHLRRAWAAHEQRYKRDKHAYDLQQAISLSKRLLRTNPPDRKVVAAKLTELEAVTLTPADQQLAATDGDAELVVSRLVVLSQQSSAEVRLGKAAFVPTPLIVDLNPGSHALVIRADGFIRSAKTALLIKGLITVIDVDLDPLPAKLLVTGPENASVHVDGTFVGVLPLRAPVEVEPGSRVVTVTKTGYGLFRTNVTTKRGEISAITVELSVTGQRIGASVLLGLGSVGLGAGVVFGVLTFVAKELEPKDDFRVASGALAGVGLGCFLIGGALFILDDRDVPMAGGLPAHKGRRGTKRSVVSVDIVPVVSSEMAGFWLTGTF